VQGIQHGQIAFARNAENGIHALRDKQVNKVVRSADSVRAI
jgi:hypothetical protein